MKTSILIVISISLIAVGCSTTTYFNLKATYPKSIKKQLNKVEKDSNVGVQVSLLLSNGNEVNGELLSVRDSTMTLRAEYSPQEEELAKLTYPVSLISNNEIQQLTIEGSNWVLVGIVAGVTVGVLAALLGRTTTSENEEESSNLAGLAVSLGLAAGWGLGYALSKEEYVLKEIPPDYDWSILKPLARYPDEEPEYLKAIK